MVAGIKSEFAKYCKGCKLSFTDVTIADVATKIQPNVQSALASDPSINYVICLYDSAEAPFAEAAIRAAGRTGKVKISSFNGTPNIMKEVKKGDIVAADVAENLDWIGYAIVDQSMRIMGGLPAGQECPRAGALLRLVEHRAGRRRLHVGLRQRLHRRLQEAVGRELAWATPRRSRV